MPRFRCRLSGLDTSAAVRLSSPSRSPPDAIMRAFSSSLTTTVFSQRSMRRLDASPRRATPKGHQSFISRTAPQSVTRYPSDLPRSWHTPLAKSHLMDADVPGDLSDRTATVKDESYRLLLVLRRKCAACRTHFSLSRRIGQLSRVSTEAGTVHTGNPRVPGVLPGPAGHHRSGGRRAA